MELNEVIENSIEVWGEGGCDIKGCVQDVKQWIKEKLPPISGYSPEATEILKKYRDKVLDNMGIEEKG